MTDEMKLDRAKKVYDTLCEVLEEYEWKYEKDEDELVIKCGAQGEDLPMDIKITVSAGRQMVLLLSHMPFVIAEDKRMEGAIATCAATYVITEGSFDYDISDGTISFRMTASFRESEIGEELFMYMVAYSSAVVDEYNDKFFAVGKGLLSISDYLENI